MATFSVGYNFVVWTGQVTVLKTAAWNVNLTAVYDISATRKAFVGWKSTAAFPAVTQLVPAASGALPRVYMFDVKTAFSLDDSLVGLVVQVPQVPNALPIASAGADLAITLPTSAVQLVGTGIDTDGTVASQGWAQVTGPQPAVLSAPTMPTTVASGLVEGVYFFDFTVTDNKGGTNTDRVMVTVNPVPQPIITSFTPGTGPVGAVCTVTGNGFGNSQNGSTGAINGVPVGSFISWSNTSVVFPVPAGASTGKLSLTTAGGTAVSATDFTVQVAALPILFAVDGNSGVANTSDGSNPADFSGDDIPAQSLRILVQEGYSMIGRNYAVGGQTTVAMLGDVVTQVDPLATDSAYSRHILLVTEWANDVTLGGADPTEAYQRFVRYCRDRQAAGWEVVIIDQVARATYLGSMTLESYAEAKSEVNLLHANNWRSYASNIVKASLLTIVQTDGTHPDLASKTKIAVEVAAAIKQVIDHTVPAQTLPLPPAHFATLSGNGALLELPTNAAYKAVAFYVRLDRNVTYNRRGVFLATAKNDFSQVIVLNTDIPVSLDIMGWADGVRITDSVQPFGTSNWVTGYFEGIAGLDRFTLLGSPIATDGDYLSVPGDVAKVRFYYRLWTPAERANSANGTMPGTLGVDYEEYDVVNINGALVPGTNGSPAAQFGTPLPTIH
jgi:hypothetical protein